VGSTSGDRAPRVLQASVGTVGGGAVLA